MCVKEGTKNIPGGGADFKGDIIFIKYQLYLNRLHVNFTESQIRNMAVEIGGLYIAFVDPTHHYIAIL